MSADGRGSIWDSPYASFICVHLRFINSFGGKTTAKEAGMFGAAKKSTIILVFSLVAFFGGPDLAAAQQAFVDPAPPAVLDAGGAETSSVATPELTFHAAPKPLPAGAAVTDWLCFLGPTHNAFSTETKLLQKFPANGLAAVWEYKKGEGYAQPVISNNRLILFHRVGDDEAID